MASNRYSSRILAPATRAAPAELHPARGMYSSAAAKPSFLHPFKRCASPMDQLGIWEHGNFGKTKRTKARRADMIVTPPGKKGKKPEGLTSSHRGATRLGGILPAGGARHPWVSSTQAALRYGSVGAIHRLNLAPATRAAPAELHPASGMYSPAEAKPPPLPASIQPMCEPYGSAWHMGAR